MLVILSLYIYGSHAINNNKNNQKILKEKFNIKIISPNFKLEYNLTEAQIMERLKKLIRYSEPNKNIETLFIWPEGVFSGYSYEDILF